MRPTHQSDAKLIIDCLARYRAERLSGIDTSNVYSWIGSAVHAGIEAGYRGTATGNRDILDCALEGLDAWFAEQDAAMPLRVKTEAETLLRRAYAEDSRLWLRMPGRDTKIVVEQAWAMDEEFNAVPLDSPDVAYAGTIDVLMWGPNGVQLRDHKTSQAMVSGASLEGDIQGWLYSLWALSNFGVGDVSWGLNMIRHGYLAEYVFKKGEPWERQAKRLYRSVRAAALAAEQTGEYSETPGFGCSYCVVSEKCAALSALKARGSVPADISPESAARSYLALKTHVAGYERIARKAAEDGPIPVGIGRVLGFKAGETEKWKYGVADLLGQLRADGATEEDLREWFPGASISKASMEAAALILLKRGEIECAEYEYVGLLREKVPSATFTTFMGESDE